MMAKRVDRRRRTVRRGIQYMAYKIQYTRLTTTTKTTTSKQVGLVAVPGQHVAPAVAAEAEAGATTAATATTG